MHPYHMYIVTYALLHLGSYWVILDPFGSGTIKRVITQSRSPPRDEWLFPIQLHQLRRRPATRADGSVDHR